LAKSPRLTHEVIAALGVDKLAQIALDAAQRDVIFKKHLNAALAGSKGPKAIIAMIDRRLTALEKARSSIDWDKTKAFAQDLRAAVDNISTELGAVDPETAIDRLFRFLRTSGAVSNRVDDSNGTIQRVYYTAIEAFGPLSAQMSEANRKQLPTIIMEEAKKNDYEYFNELTQLVIGNIPLDAISEWDNMLKEKQTALIAKVNPNQSDWNLEKKISTLRISRQIIATTRNDLDGYIALEETQSPCMQNTISIAKKLIEANRPEEALIWVHKNMPFIRDTKERDLTSRDNVLLEASILDTLKRKTEANKLRWNSFCQTLDTQMLREHVRHLDDFSEFDVLERAYNYAYNFNDKYRALKFLIEWAELDLASKLVIETADNWDLSSYGIFHYAATALKQNYPLAATILYRLFVTNVVSTGNSSYYSDAAKYLKELAHLATAFDELDHPSMTKHAIYHAELLRLHSKKRTFWEMVKSN
jgi:hypothetical protein